MNAKFVNLRKAFLVSFSLLAAGSYSIIKAQDLPLSASFSSVYDPVSDSNIYHVDFSIANTDDDHAPIHSKDLNQPTYNAQTRNFDPGYTWIKREVFHNNRQVEGNPLSYIVIRMRGYHPGIADGQYSDNDIFNPDFRYELCYRFCDGIVSDDELNEVGQFGTPIQVYKPNDDEDVALHAIASWGDISEWLANDTQYGDYSFRYVYLLNKNIRRYSNFVDFKVPVAGMKADPLGTHSLSEDTHVAGYEELPVIDNRTFVSLKTIRNTDLGGQHIVAYSIIDESKNELCRLTSADGSWNVTNSEYSIVNIVNDRDYEWVVMESPVSAGDKVYAQMIVSVDGSDRVNYYGISPKACVLPSLDQTVEVENAGREGNDYVFKADTRWSLDSEAEGALFSQWRCYNDKTYGEPFDDGYYMNILDHNQAKTGSIPEEAYGSLLDKLYGESDNQLIEEGGNWFGNRDLLSQVYNPDTYLSGEYVLRAYLPSSLPVIEVSEADYMAVATNEASVNDMKYIVLEARSEVAGRQDENTTGVEEIATDDAEPVYYDAMGRKVDLSSVKGGFVIEVKGSSVKKLINR